VNREATKTAMTIVLVLGIVFTSGLLNCRAEEKAGKSKGVAPLLGSDENNFLSKEKVIGSDTKSFSDWLDLGNNARLRGDFDTATDEFSEALKIKDDPKVHILLGDVLCARNQIDAAINQYKLVTQNRASDLDSTIKAWRSLGRCYQSKKDFPNSVAAYNEAIGLNGPDRETLEANRAIWVEAVRNSNTHNRMIGDHGLQDYRDEMNFGDYDPAGEWRRARVFTKDCPVNLLPTNAEVEKDNAKSPEH